jgi:hypothetical protein
MHAQVRIGNAVLEMGEPDPAVPMPTTLLSLRGRRRRACIDRAVAAGRDGR